MVLPPPASTPLSYDDLEDLPDDGRRYELIDGSLVVTPVPALVHQLVVGAIYRLLWSARRAGTAVLTAPVDLVPQARPRCSLTWWSSRKARWARRH